MIRIALLAAVAATAALPMAAQANEVAGRPALTTTSTSDLLEQRAKWGDKPVKTYKD